MQIHFDLRTLLPLVRAAVDQELLPSGTASYSGPCALGIGLTTEQRHYLDFVPDVIPTIGQLLKAGHVTCPAGQENDLADLQYKHDLSPDEEFPQTLQRLENKYA